MLPGPTKVKKPDLEVKEAEDEVEKKKNNHNEKLTLFVCKLASLKLQALTLNPPSPHL